MKPETNICIGCLYRSKLKDGICTCAMTGMRIEDFVREGAVSCSERKERGDCDPRIGDPFGEIDRLRALVTERDDFLRGLAIEQEITDRLCSHNEVLKTSLAEAEKVVDAAKQLNAAMNLSMDVKTYKCILDKTLTAYEEGKP